MKKEKGKYDEQFQMLQMLKAMGIDLNPLSNANGLVQLMNESAKPDMFNREMDLRERSFQSDAAYKNGSLDLNRLEQKDRSEYMKQSPLWGLLGDGINQGSFPSPGGGMAEWLASQLRLPAGMFDGEPPPVKGGNPELDSGAIKKSRESRGW